MLSNETENEDRLRVGGNVSRRSDRTKIGVISIAFVAVALVGLAIAAVFYLEFSRAYRDDQDFTRLRRLHLAMMIYYDEQSAFPSPDLGGHSWRIRIANWVDEDRKGQFYNYNVHWTDNLLSEMNESPFDVPVDFSAPIAMAPSDAKSRWATDMLMITGPNAFGKPKGFRRLDEISDPLSTTIIISECRNQINWLSPNDISMSDLTQSPNGSRKYSPSSDDSRGPLVLFADGFVGRLSPKTPPDVVKALMTINGDEEISREGLMQQGLLTWIQPR